MIDIKDKGYCPTLEVRTVYEQTKAGNGQKWLMIDLEDSDSVYEDVFRLMDIRRG